jgi:uncharacterized protein
MDDLITATFFSILAAGFFVGIVVGLTGMGGGALMTPALIFLGVGEAATVVTADLTAAAVYKTGGALVHAKEGSPNLDLAKWLIIGSVPMALLGPHLVAGLTSDEEQLDYVLKMSIGFALLLAASTYALRLYINLRRVRGGVPNADPNPPVRPLPTMLVGALGGLLVGITSVGSGSVIMVALLMLYPGLAAVRLVGTDLVQAVPLVASAALAHALFGDLDMSVTWPLLVGSIPGVFIGAQMSARMTGGFVRRALAFVLLASALKMLGVSNEATAAFLLATLLLAPPLWMLIRRRHGFAPTAGMERRRRAARPPVATDEQPVAEIEQPVTRE